MRDSIRRSLVNPYLSHTQRNASWQQQFLPLAEFDMRHLASGTRLGSLCLFQAGHMEYVMSVKGVGLALQRWPYAGADGLIQVLQLFVTASRGHAASLGAELENPSVPKVAPAAWYLAYMNSCTVLGKHPDPFGHTQAVPPGIVEKLGAALQEEFARQVGMGAPQTAFSVLASVFRKVLPHSAADRCATTLSLAALALQDGIAEVPDLLDARAARPLVDCPLARGVAPELSASFWNRVHSVLFLAEEAPAGPLWMGCADILAAVLDELHPVLSTPHGAWLRAQLSQTAVS